MSKFLDYDELRGLRQDESRDRMGRLQIHYSQDVEPILKLCEYERTHGLADKAGKKQDMYLYARIPPVVQLEIKHKYGVDVNNPNHLKRAFDILNQHYPKLKCTDKHHELNR